MLLGWCCLSVVAANSPFVSTWQARLGENSVTIPLSEAPVSNFTVDWGDGDVETGIFPVTHSYSVAGSYNISISGDIYGFQFPNAPLSAPNLVDIVSWGDSFFINGSSSNVFDGCINLHTISAPPNTQPVFLPGATLIRMFANSGFNSPLNWDLTNVVSLQGMFEFTSSFNQPLVFSNMQGVTDLSKMFYGASAFNFPLNFDTVSVGLMSEMFSSASSFNSPINFTNTGNVTRMNGMFYAAASFNQPVNFDTGKVQFMDEMFAATGVFNQPINFDTSSLASTDSMFDGALAFNNTVNFTSTPFLTSTRFMFKAARSFNQPITFQTNNVTQMSNMFNAATSFNQPLSFNTSNVQLMEYMFYGASAFNQPINFDSSSLGTAEFMFGNTAAFNSTVNFSNTLSVTNFAGMFSETAAFNQPLNFQTDNATTMQGMFSGAQSFNQPLNFNTGKVLVMTTMFRGTQAFNQPVNFDGSNLIHTGSMFANAARFNSPVNLTNTSLLISVAAMFRNASRFNQPITFQTNSVMNMGAMFSLASSFNQPVSNLSTSAVTTMALMFYGAFAFNQPINFDAPTLGFTDGMFAYASTFNSSVNFTNSNLTTTSSMFQNATVFNQPITISTDFVTDMSFMFSGARSFNQPVNFSTGRVQLMNSMFEFAIAFNQSIDFDTSSVTTCEKMFSGALKFNKPLNFFTPSLTRTDYMFLNALAFNSPVYLSPTPMLTSTQGMFMNAVSFDKPLGLPTLNVVNMSCMFSGARSFNQPVSFLETRNVISMSYMFFNTSRFNQEVEFKGESLIDASFMFAGATNFNQTVSFTTVANVENMDSMFLNVSRDFQQDLTSWNTSSVVNCPQFCHMCGLPRFPRCQPCSPKYRRSPTVSVCNCPAATSCSVELPASEINASFVLVATTNATATVFIPPDPVFHNNTLVANIAPGNGKTESNTIVSLTLEDLAGNVVDVSNLSTPISIVFELHKPMNPNAVSQCLGSGFVVAPVLPTCSYFNEETLQWDTAGCSVAEFNSTHVRCNCTHFTLFAVLAPKHNKVVPSEILDLTPANIDAHPTGLVTVMIILCLFAVMFMAAVLVDRAEAAKYEELRLSKQEKWKSFAAENRKATLLKQLKIAFQKRHTWFSLVFRKSGTSFRSADRAFVTLLSAFASMSVSAFYHAQDNNNIARIGVIIISVLVCAVPSQLLIQLFVRTGSVGFYEEWEQSRKPPQTNKWLAYRFPEHWRHVWRVATLIVVIAMIVYVLGMSMNFDRQPFFFCRDAAALAWVSTWLAAYAMSIFLVEPARIVLMALLGHFSDSLPRTQITLTERELASKGESPGELEADDTTKQA